MATTPTRPKLITHHGYRSWTSTWRDDDRKKRTKRFGRAGEVTKQQAEALYDNWLQTEWGRYDHVQNPDADVYTVERLRADYLAFARTIYRKGGQETSYVLNLDLALTSLVKQYPGLPADELGNPMLAKLRDAMIHKENGKTRAMQAVNDRLHAIQQAYGWARERGYVSAATLADVRAVSRLRRGRSAARDPVKVRPIDWTVVAETKAESPPTTRRHDRPAVAHRHAAWRGVRHAAVRYRDERRRLALPSRALQAGAPRARPRRCPRSEGSGDHQAVSDSAAGLLCWLHLQTESARLALRRLLPFSSSADKYRLSITQMVAG